MVIVDFVEFVLHWLAETVGLNGLAIGTTALATVGLWYLREISDVLATLAVYARVASAVMFAFLLVLVVGTATGVIDLSADSSALGQAWRAMSNLLHLHP